MSSPEPRNILFRLTRPPYGSSHARDALDAILATAAFEQNVSLLFLGDGLYQLLPNQAPQHIQQKNFTAAFGLFELYGLTQFYADEESLRARGLSPNQLVLPVQPLDRAGISALMRRQNQIISF